MGKHDVIFKRKIVELAAGVQWWGGGIHFIKKNYINSEPKTLHNAEKFNPTYKIVILAVALCSVITHYILTIIKPSYIIFIL